MKKFIDYTENLRRATLNQRRLIHGLLLILVVLAGTNVYLALHHTEILVPYNLNKKTAISVRRVTANYLSYLAAADASLYFYVDLQNI